MHKRDFSHERMNDYSKIMEAELARPGALNHAFETGLEQALLRNEALRKTQPDVIADGTILSQTAYRLHGSGFNVEIMHDTRNQGLPREALLEYAARTKRIIFTHSRRLASPDQFLRSDAPGVVVLPAEMNVYPTPNCSPVLAAAIDHLKDNIVRLGHFWKTRILRYQPNGIVMGFSIPTKPGKQRFVAHTERFFSAPAP